MTALQDGLFKSLRESLADCRVGAETHADVAACIIPVVRKAEADLKADHRTMGLYACELPNKERHEFLLELARLAEAAAFDVEDIATIRQMACRGGNNSETSIDAITLKPSNLGPGGATREARVRHAAPTFLLKHSGSSSDIKSDAQTHADVMLVASVLGEETPLVPYVSPTGGFIALTYFRHRPSKDSEQRLTGYKEYRAHELVTTLIFETLIADVDRNNPGNTVTVDDVLIGHLDFTRSFSSGSYAPTSWITRRLLRDLEGDGVDQVEAEVPGLRNALVDGYARWQTTWRPALEALGSPIATAEALAHVDVIFERLVGEEAEHIREQRERVRRAKEEDEQAALEQEEQEHRENQGAEYCAEAFTDLDDALELLREILPEDAVSAPDRARCFDLPRVDAKLTSAESAAFGAAELLRGPCTRFSDTTDQEQTFNNALAPVALIWRRAKLQCGQPLPGQRGLPHLVSALRSSGAPRGGAR